MKQNGSGRKLDHSLVLYTSEGWFDDRSPSNFLIRDFFMKDQNGNYQISDVIGHGIRCSNLFEESKENIGPLLFIEKEGILAMNYIYYCKSPRFLTMCKYFILHQIEYSGSSGFDEAYLTIGDYEVIDGRWLMNKFKTGMNIVMKDIDIMNRIEYLESKANYLTRVQWMCIFSYATMKIEKCYEILEIGVKDSDCMRCSVCKFNGSRYGPMLEDYNENIIQNRSDVSIRISDPDIYFEPVWDFYHNYKKVVIRTDGPYFHHRVSWNDHFHYRIEGSIDLKTISKGNVSIDLTAREIVVAKLFIMIAKFDLRRNYQTYNFGLQNYCLYPFEKLFENFSDELGVKMTAWLYFFKGAHFILHNSDDSIFLHLVSFISVLEDGYPYSELVSIYNKELIKEIKVFYKQFRISLPYYDQEKDVVTNMSGYSVWFDLYAKIVKGLKEYGCECDSCKNYSFPKLERHKW